MNSKSGTYTPRADEAVADQHSSEINLSGASPRGILHQQASAQRVVAESEKWLIARKVDHRSDNRAALEELGFTILNEHDDLFYEVEPPVGWSKSTDGYWTTIKDESGNERISQFYKGAFYDRDAFANIS